MSLNGLPALQGEIYWMDTSYSRSYSPGSMSRARLARTNTEDIRNQVHALTELVQRQFEEADRRYMELNERHKRDKEQWTQQIQSMEQRMMTMCSYFEQMRSGVLFPVHSLHHLHPVSLLHTTIHPETTTTASRILTMVSIRRFQNFSFLRIIL